ncbi:hypothetical protein RN001_013396 [Aquatica leii]|uniref:BESS domain-containing protein n=1 Tax=Aquatica leii TaxID=1421715 RepID=A0AAN7S711_9COLE|nr:hypothetical protein RN001_013396 [Aquatica leii]
MHLLNINYLLIFNCFYIASALVCFDCFSTTIGFCGIHFSPSKASRAICYRNETVCFIENNVIKGIKVVTRNCGYGNRCINNTNCVTCTKSLCNSASNFSSSRQWKLGSNTVLVIIGLWPRMQASVGDNSWAIQEVPSKKTRTGQAADPKATWKYGDILEFLHSFMKDKERLTSVTTENPSVSTINDEDEVSQDSEASYTPNASQILITSQDETLLRDNQSNLQVTVLQNKKEKTPKRAKSNVKVFTQAHTASGTLMKYLLEEEKTKKTEVKDELHFFFESIKATVRTFSPADKHLVKSKIFGIVSDIEAKYIHQQQHIQNFSVYQASNSQVPLTIESPSTNDNDVDYGSYDQTKTSAAEYELEVKKEWPELENIDKTKSDKVVEPDLNVSVGSVV